MELMVITGRHDPHTAAEFARAARNLVQPDQIEVGAFCDRLTGLIGDTHEEIAEEVQDLILPSGYTHVRMFDASGGLQLTSAISRRHLPLTGPEVAMMVTLHERFDEGRWVETTPLPVRDKGVLDLLIRFETRAVSIVD